MSRATGIPPDEMQELIDKYGQSRPKQTVAQRYSSTRVAPVCEEVRLPEDYGQSRYDSKASTEWELENLDVVRDHYRQRDLNIILIITAIIVIPLLLILIIKNADKTTQWDEVKTKKNE